jgi:hypothetical protein
MPPELLGVLLVAEAEDIDGLVGLGSPAKRCHDVLATPFHERFKDHLPTSAPSASPTATEGRSEGGGGYTLNIMFKSINVRPKY